MTQCTHCLLDLSLHPSVQAGVCPNCGHRVGEQSSESSARVAPLGPGAPMALLAQFWNNMRDIILRPKHFFSEHAPALVADGGLSSALAFAVIIQWLASFFNFIWRSTVGILIQNRMNDLFRIAEDVMHTNPGVSVNLDVYRQRAVEFLFGAGAIVLTPFTTLLKLAVVALFVHAAVRFFMKETPGRPHSYSTTLKILAYASAPWILCLIPGVGAVLGWLLAFVAAVIGLREVYQSTTSRSVLAVVFPELLFMVLLLSIAVFFLFLAFNVLRLVF